MLEERPQSESGEVGQRRDDEDRPTSSTMKMVPVVGKVPGEGGTVFFSPSEPGQRQAGDDEDVAAPHHPEAADKVQNRPPGRETGEGAAVVGGLRGGRRRGSPSEAVRARV